MCKALALSKTAIKELKRIVDKLEEGRLPLEEFVQNFDLKERFNENDRIKNLSELKEGIAELEREHLELDKLKEKCSDCQMPFQN